MRPQSCEAVLLRSLARYPGNVEGSYLDYAKAREMEPGTLEGYALAWSLEILYVHLTLVLQTGNVGAQFRMPQTSLTLGAEALLTREFDLAERCFRSVLDFRSDAVFAAVGLGLVRFWRGEEEAAKNDLAALRIQNERFQRFVEALRAGPGADDAPLSDPKKG
ncbi:MAG TPA: hypothetical protein VKU80_06580, partial [Planctomycetota bacterium]|nr:hypothetical protein [Planctomycetota bacterium]